MLIAVVVVVVVVVLETPPVTVFATGPRFDGAGLGAGFSAAAGAAAPFPAAAEAAAGAAAGAVSEAVEEEVALEDAEDVVVVEEEPHLPRAAEGPVRCAAPEGPFPPALSPPPPPLPNLACKSLRRLKRDIVDVALLS